MKKFSLFFPYFRSTSIFDELDNMLNTEQSLYPYLVYFIHVYILIPGLRLTYLSDLKCGTTEVVVYFIELFIIYEYYSIMCTYNACSIEFSIQVT